MSTEIIIAEDALVWQIGRLVHVQGWNKGACFRYLGTEGGIHQLETPKTKKKVTTRLPLTYTKFNIPSEQRPRN